MKTVFFALSASSLLLLPQVGVARPLGLSPTSIVDEALSPSARFKVPLRWVTVRNNSIPANTVFGGQEANTQPLYLCRGEYEKGVHVGKTRPEFGGCYIGWGGKSVLLANYQVLVDQGSVTWVTGTGGSIPSTAFAGGQENNENLYICMAKYQGGYHSGKIRQAFRGCSIAWGSQEIIVPVYDVLTIPPSRASDPVGGQVSRVELGLSGNFAFGSVSVGQTKTSTLTIQNTGNSTLNISSIDYPVGFSGAWSGSVNAGATQSVNVTFKPTQAQSYGGSLVVNSNKTAGTSQLTLSGTGVTVANNAPITGSQNINTSDGQPHTYYYRVPATAAPATGRPVLIYLHGQGGTGANFAAKFHPFTDPDGAVVIAPNGVNQTWTHAASDIAGLPLDAQFIEKIVNILKTGQFQGQPVNPSKIYLTGDSRGGFMPYYLLQRAGTRNAFAAVGVNAGLMYCQNNDNQCNDQQSNQTLHSASTPIIHVHGTNDAVVQPVPLAAPLVAPNDPTYWNDAWRVFNPMKFFAEQNGCFNPSPVTAGTLFTPANSTQIKGYDLSSKGAVCHKYQLYLVTNGGHVPASMEKTIWNFLRSY